MIDRRTFLAGTGEVLLAAPLAAEAQQTEKVWRIGWLGNILLTDPLSAVIFEAFRKGLQEHGYVEGRNLPVILDPEDEALWLDPGPIAPEEKVLLCLRPYPSERMETIPVSSLVSSPSNKGPELIEPVPAGREAKPR